MISPISAKRKAREKGTSLMVGVTALVFLVPLTGLTVDVGMIYAVKSKLQGAVDGSALAAARALSLGQDQPTETASAQTNATLWFNANFPTGTWATSGTTLNPVAVNFSPTVNGTTVQNMIQITLNATTNVPTWFMKWFHINSTLIGSTGQTTRRDINSMLVLDRSSSMQTTASCPSLISAAMQFTGQFVNTRDKIGAVSFSDGVYLHSKPATGFQTTLGYVDNAGTAHNGAASVGLNNIVCTGGTGTAQAISEAYNELYKIAQPGAFNVIVLETDGLPNTMVLNWDMGTFGAATPKQIWTAFNTNTNIAITSNDCTDAAGKTAKNGGWLTTATVRDWTSPAGGHSMNTGGTGYMADIPGQMIGAVYSMDPQGPANPPNPGTQFGVLGNAWHTSSNQGITTAVISPPGCGATGGFGYPVTPALIPDLGFLPATDVYGNQLNPATNPYSNTLVGKAVTVNGVVHTEVAFPSGALSEWQTYHNAALNATDNAAYNARVGTNLGGNPFQVTIYVIGLGGNTSYVPDYTLLQRMANDPLGDPNPADSPALWLACPSQPGCVSYPSSQQPQGQFIWANGKSQLADAFKQIASQVLRISK
jgi:Flp pilus assembly protein TadG